MTLVCGEVEAQKKEAKSTKIDATSAKVVQGVPKNKLEVRL